MHRDPESRKRVARPNPVAEWVIFDKPELRIVDDATWRAAVEIFDRQAERPLQQRNRPRRLFSGLLSCGICGGSYVTTRTEQWGCSRHKESGSCANNRTISNKSLEARVIGALRDRLLQPEAVAEFVKGYHLRLERDRVERAGQRASIERAHARADGRVKRLAMAIADGAGDVAEVRELLSLESAERDRTAAQLRELDATPVIALHPGIADDYRRRIDALSVELEQPQAGHVEAKAIMRGLLDSIVAFRRPKAAASTSRCAAVSRG